MAWTSIGSGSTVAYSGNNQASMAHTVATNGVGIGQVGIIAFAQDNPGAADTFTTSGTANPTVSTVTDSAGNIWNCAGEFQNAQGSAQAGAVCSLWWTLATADLPVAGTITATLVPGSSASFDAGASALWVYSIGGNQVSVLASTGLAADATTALGLIDQTVSTGSNLRFRAIASETTATTALTTSSGWSAIGVVRASAAKAMGVRGEYLITASSTAASSPGLNVATIDHASVYVVMQETTATSTVDGDGAAVVDVVATGGGNSLADSSGSAVVEVVSAGDGNSLADSPGSAVVDLVASSSGDGQTALVGSANIDFVSVAVGEDGSTATDTPAASYGEFAYGEAAYGDSEVGDVDPYQNRSPQVEIGIVAEGAGAVTVPIVGLAEFAIEASGGGRAVTLRQVRVIQTAPRSRRGRTGLSHSGE